MLVVHNVCSSSCRYATPDYAQQSFQNPSTIISDSRVHIFICHPLPYALNLAGCILGKLKVHIQILLCIDRTQVEMHTSQHIDIAAQEFIVNQQIGCVGWALLHTTARWHASRLCMTLCVGMVRMTTAKLAASVCIKTPSSMAGGRWVVAMKATILQGSLRSPQNKWQTQLGLGSCATRRCHTAGPSWF